MNANRPTQPLRDEHAELLPHITSLAQAARDLPSLDDDGRRAAISEARSFLEGHLVPHALAEEAVLYPAWSAMVGYPDAAATLIREHEAIVARIHRLAEAAPDDLPEAQEVLFGLHALITTHFGSEEDLVLDALDTDPEMTAGLLARLHEGHAGP